jgi:hypothetical protein
MNAVISVIRRVIGGTTHVAFAAAAAVAPVSPPTAQDVPLSLVEAGAASQYIRVVVAR